MDHIVLDIGLQRFSSETGCARAGTGVDHFDIKIWEGTDTEADPVHKTKNILAGRNIIVHTK